MARQTLSKQTPLGPYPSLPISADALDLVFTAADPANKEEFAASANDLVLVWNTGAAAYTVTFTSVADGRNNRTGDVTTYSIDADEIAAFRFKKQGWAQTDGKIYMEASDASIKYAVLEI